MSCPRRSPQTAVFHWEPQAQPCPSRLSFFTFGRTARHEESFPRPGVGPAPLPWKRGVLAAGPPGQSLQLVFFFFFLILTYLFWLRQALVEAHGIFGTRDL